MTEVAVVLMLAVGMPIALAVIVAAFYFDNGDSGDWSRLDIAGIGGRTPTSSRRSRS